VSNNLNAQKALIFRIIHCRNVPWVLDHGIHCGSSTTRDANYITIGHADLISKRTSRSIPIAPRGTLANYVPSYFTPYSPLMLNIDIIDTLNEVRLNWPKSGTTRRISDKSNEACQLSVSV
jgi:hypothetical protein